MNPQEQSEAQVSKPNPVTSTVPTSGSGSTPNSTTVLQQIPGPFELLKSSWELYKNHWKVLIPIIILPPVIMYIGSLLNFTHQVGFSIIGGLLSLVGGVISIVMVPAIVDAINRLSTEPSTVISLQEQYKKGFTFFWSVLLIGIIYCLIVIGSFMLLIIPGIIVIVYACLYSYTLVIDGKRGFSALVESYSLVYGRWWPVLGRIFFLIITMLIGWFILLGVGFLVGLILGIPMWEATQSVNKVVSKSFGTVSISFVLNLIGSAILAPIAIGYTYKMYISLKNVRSSVIDSTKTFKNWLVAFLCVGIASMLAMIIIIPIMIFVSYKSIIPKILSNPSIGTQLNNISSTSTLKDYILKMDSKGIIQGNRPGGPGPSGTTTK